MWCCHCDQPLGDGEFVRMSQDGQIVRGKFAPVEEPRIWHEVCPGQED